MSEFADIFSNTWAFVLVLLFFGGSIFVHEFGHFLAARLRGLKVTRFSIGFGPRIFSWRGKDGCQYILSLLPFGGYVALPQLADMGAIEGGDGEEETKNLPKASCADKVIVSAAGAFFNVLFAAVLAAVIWGVGITKSAALETTVVGYVPENITDVHGTKFKSPAKSAGLAAGDKILSIDGRSVKDFSQIIELIAIGAGRNAEGKPMAELEISRNGKIKDIKIYPVLIKTNLSTGDEIRMVGISPAMPMKVGKVMENSPAFEAGIKPGDEVTGINGVKLYSNGQLGAYLDALESEKSAMLEIVRDGKKTSVEVRPKKVALTKSLAVLEAPDGDGSVSFLLSNKNNPRAKNGILKVFEIKKGAEPFDRLSIGDILYEVNGKPVGSLEELNTIVNGSSKSSRLKFSIASPDSRMFDIVMPAALSSKIELPQTKTMLGYMLAPAVVVSHPSIIEQFEESVVRTYNALSSLVNPQSDVGISSLAGPVDIGRVIYRLSMTDFILVLSFAVLLNINLAILNMLPVPVLDGGHILFAVVEKLRGKPLPASFFAAVQGVFSILLISLMVYVVYYGFMRWSGDSRQEANDSLATEYYLKDISF